MLEGLRFRVLRADSRRLHTLQVERLAPPRRRRRPGVSRLRDAVRAALVLAFAAGAACGVRLRAVPRRAAAASRRSRCCSGSGSGGDAARRRRSIGFAFGLGLFGVGISWISIALETFGGMPRAGRRSRHAGFVAYLALCPALAGWAVARLTRAGTVRAPRRRRRARGRWPSGCAACCSPASAGSPSATRELAAGGSAAARGLRARRRRVPRLARAGRVRRRRRVRHRRHRRRTRARDRRAASLAIALLRRRGRRASRASNGRSRQGAPLAVSLVQGNVAQNAEVRSCVSHAQLRDVRASSCRRAQGTPRRPAGERVHRSSLDEMPGDVFLRHRAPPARARDGDVLLGLFTLEPPPAGTGEGRAADLQQRDQPGRRRRRSSTASITWCRSASRFR